MQKEWPRTYTETHHYSELYPPYTGPYTFKVALTLRIGKFVAALCLFQMGATSTRAQEAGGKPAEKAAAAEKKAEKPQLPFQIQLLETHIRFEANGDSRKEVHTIVKMNNILGARQFARLTFEYNRGFQQVEIPLVRISHANGGTSEVLPSAIADAPNPAVEKFLAYQDVRVKSVRVLGLQEGDTVEYRVITTTTNHPLAPDFWLEHSFDRSGQVLEEQYEVDLPAARKLLIRVNPGTPATSTDKSGEGDSARSIYLWHLSSGRGLKDEPHFENTKEDIVITTFEWGTLESSLQSRLAISVFPPGFQAKARQLTTPYAKQEEKLSHLYDLVSKEMRTVDLPIGATGYRLREPLEILSSGYAVPEEKCALLSALISTQNDGSTANPALVLDANSTESDLARPTLLSNILVAMEASQKGKELWLDPTIEVAPFGMIPLDLRGRTAMPLISTSHGLFEKVPSKLPFAAFQRVGVDATLAGDGNLTATVKYTLRGDNELLLRVAFHQTAKEKWKDIAGLLAISDGFRGQVTNVSASDPMETKEPFMVEYEISQPKFVDWTKKPVRIPAVLPQIGLPEPPARPAVGGKAQNIELGTPLNVETRLTMKLPVGTTAQAPAGTTVDRDYAAFASKYGATQGTITASRHINFLMREIPADRAMDYNAFLHAVQNDQAQLFTLEATPVPVVNSEQSPAATKP